MLKKIISLISAVTLSITLVSCSSGTKKENAIGNNQTQEEKNNDNKGNKNSKGTAYEIEGAVVEDSGITQTIKEVSVFNNMKDAIESYGQSNLVIKDENKDKVSVVVKFEIKNDNDFEISTYPTQAIFITNIGEQVGADLWASESFDGEIYEGVTKEGHILFNLNKTSKDELNSFKMIWNTSHDNGTPDDYDDDYYKENKLEVILK